MKKFLFDESGTTVIEYALLLSLVAGAIFGVLSVFGDSLESNYRVTNDQVAAVEAQMAARSRPP